MSKARFGLGEIALTAYNRFSENRGKTVLLKEYLGKLNWPQVNEPQHVWLVECACQSTYLYYLYPKDRELTRVRSGPMPECFLRRITPECGQVVLELFESTPTISFDDVTV